MFQVDNVDSEVEQPAAAAAAPAPVVTAREALRHSFTVGLSGGGATVFSVATMMWLHTIITYQQRHGTKFGETCKVCCMHMCDDRVHVLTDHGLQVLYDRLLSRMSDASHIYCNRRHREVSEANRIYEAPSL